MLTETIARIDKTRAASIIAKQLPQTPLDWKQHFRNEAEKLRREARIDVVQQTPFDAVIRKLRGATSMIRIKVWCEGSTDRPIFQKLFEELGEHDIAESIGLVGGWPNLLAETQPERWLDGCREAIIVMDGDVGRTLTKKTQPLTEQARQLNRRFASHALKLRVLRRHGIENYFPQHACEIVLQRDLAEYFPIPPHTKIEDHFREPKSEPVSFYQKRRNEEVARQIAMADVEGTDLAAILYEVKERAEEARQL
jgi:hypothetical protein